MIIEDRISGEAASKDTRAGWSDKKLIDNIKRMIRSDYGGKDKFEVTENRLMEKLGDEAKYLPEYMRSLLANVIVEMNQELVAGIQSRVSHSTEEVLRRLGNK